ncbi:MAG: hypothetical protein R3335_02500 [Anaerolineales bacterium]|nr:hypothetical protein [Anaerolineales bacterium]
MPARADLAGLIFGLVRMQNKPEMNPEAFVPFGLALKAYWEGDRAAAHLIRREDGHLDTMLVSHYFRDQNSFSELERTALKDCKGRILDVGAGAGPHTLYLQSQNLDVTALDINRDACEVSALLQLAAC